MSDDLSTSINKYKGYLLDVIPELKYMIGFNQKHPHHHLDLWEHTMYALSMSEKDFDIRLSLLLHDIGKPFSYQEGDVRHFQGHAEVSSKIAKKVLDNLGYEKVFIDKICKYIKLHDTPITSKDIESDPEFYSKLYKIQYCDALAHNPDKLEKRKVYLEKTKKLLKKI